MDLRKESQNSHKTLRNSELNYKNEIDDFEDIWNNNNQGFNGFGGFGTSNMNQSWFNQQENNQNGNHKSTGTDLMSLIIECLPIIILVGFFIVLFLVIKGLMGAAGETPFIEKVIFAVIIIAALKIFGSK